MPCSRRPVLDPCRVSVYVFVSNVRVSMSVSLDTVSLRDLNGMTCLYVCFCASSVRVPLARGPLPALVRRDQRCDACTPLTGASCLQVTGSPLQPDIFVDYLQTKYSDLYGL